MIAEQTRYLMCARSPSLSLFLSRIFRRRTFPKLILKPKLRHEYQLIVLQSNLLHNIFVCMVIFARELYNIHSLHSKRIVTT